MLGRWAMRRVDLGQAAIPLLLRLYNASTLRYDPEMIGGTLTGESIRERAARLEAAAENEGKWEEEEELSAYIREAAVAMRRRMRATLCRRSGTSGRTRRRHGMRV